MLSNAACMHEHRPCSGRHAVFASPCDNASARSQLRPTQSEKIEYLLTRGPKSQPWTSFADYALEHVPNANYTEIEQGRATAQAAVSSDSGIC